MTEPLWLELADVEKLNKKIVTQTNEPFRVLDKGMLESALVVPQNRFHYGEVDIVSLAVCLLIAIARNHPFIQGNKRTGFMAAVGFLHINGYLLAVPNQEEIGAVISNCIQGEISEADLCSFLRDFIIPREA